jgi:hypothetical protein
MISSGSTSDSKQNSNRNTLLLMVPLLLAAGLCGRSTRMAPARIRLGSTSWDLALRIAP